MKKGLLLSLFITSTVVFSQTKLNFSLSIDKSQQELVLKLVEKALGKPKELKKKQAFWSEKRANYQYKISVKKRKVTFFYKGNDRLVEHKMRTLYLKANNLNSFFESYNPM